VKVSDIETAQLAQAQDQPLLVPASAGRRELDLGRDVHALLGLVFDRIDLPGAADQIRRCVASGRRCFLSTPNVNFVAAAMHDPAFRDSVLRSDLSVPDGFPIVRVGRWMGIDLPGRVAGADIFERLQSAGRSAQRPPIKLFLFGGPPGAGAQAAAYLNAQALGFDCVGHDEGGFGDIEAMSSHATIDRINASGAEFVLVALGAKKGQAWIERNRERLRAPVLSHLGAVINFAAQSVDRAPAWMQRFGLEWLWRIVQEPQLWRRYWNDGRLLLGTVLTRLLPWSARQRLGPWPRGARQPPRFEAEDDAGRRTSIRLLGDWRNGSDQAALRATMASRLRAGRSIEFDLGASPALGSALLGLVALIDAWQVAPRALRCATVGDRALLASLHAHGMQHLLDAPRA
jgi:N-acetylglucosaminyldiphosphoundecaprenol N-acetyl-beta-D-mannosaminyltransferase